MMLQWEVGQQESGMKLAAFLQSKLADMSLRQLKRGIEANQCQINGRTERFASTLLGAGDRVSFSKKDAIKTETAPAILYQDADFLIIDKPSGLSSDSPKLLDQIKQSINQSSLAELIHRLDRDTTGVLMFARRPEAREAMIQLFRRHQVVKTYLALVDGKPDKRKGVIDNYLEKKHTYQGQALWGGSKAGSGLHALTEWEIEKSGEAASLLRCYPKTGRTHQIRVHMSEMGHPLLGDYQYGRSFRSGYRPQRCLLHAWKIAFRHPFKESAVEVEVEAPLPPDFMQAIQSLLGGRP